MPKKKGSTVPKKKGSGARKLSLKAAKKAITVTQDGKRRLVLNNMGFTIFPKCLLKLRNLDELDLSRNQIQKLPEAIGTLKSLRRLDLHSNKLESVPESIGSLIELTYLNLANNRLTSAGLPSTLGFLCQLKTLNLGLNQLDALPSTLEHLTLLQELALFDNQFIKVPEFLTNLRNLTKVNLIRNPCMFAHAESERIRKEKLEHKEELYLVHESFLCKRCLKICKAEAGKILRKERKGEKKTEKLEVLEEKKKRFSGLMTPNSVAAVTQDFWRLKSKR
ncbi:leucine-rich repeat-containing protein 18 [Poecilia reticulata]|uniref:leucine-rich repeat-containing protein 18 n=1 Tax=Poecilia reticulata TaxID=8081 RepID=UPI0004A4F0A1|nr:PREDICTED: leucine-rich repeat-containing protein 18 [Poecilia reticulata]XP_008427936.1 PREDICTED: leucine-rich repeat-containing protein 18 [Poecilia reticulata]